MKAAPFFVFSFFVIFYGSASAQTVPPSYAATRVEIQALADFLRSPRACAMPEGAFNRETNLRILRIHRARILDEEAADRFAAGHLPEITDLNLTVKPVTSRFIHHRSQRIRRGQLQLLQRLQRWVMRSSRNRHLIMGLDWWSISNFYHLYRGSGFPSDGQRGQGDALIESALSRNMGKVVPSDSGLLVDRLDSAPVPRASLFPPDKALPVQCTSEPSDFLDSLLEGLVEEALSRDLSGLYDRPRLQGSLPSCIGFAIASDLEIFRGVPLLSAGLIYGMSVYAEQSLSADAMVATAETVDLEQRVRQMVFPRVPENKLTGALGVSDVRIPFTILKYHPTAPEQRFRYPRIYPTRSPDSIRERRFGIQEYSLVARQPGDSNEIIIQ